MPDDVLLRAFTDYVVAFDTRLRNPRWVLEHINRDKGRGDANRCGVGVGVGVGVTKPMLWSNIPPQNQHRTKSDFYHDREADPRRISRNDHYRGSGYDRGHMVGVLAVVMCISVYHICVIQASTSLHNPKNIAVHHTGTSSKLQVQSAIHGRNILPAQYVTPGRQGIQQVLLRYWHGFFTGTLIPLNYPLITLNYQPPPNPPNITGTIGRDLKSL